MKKHIVLDIVVMWLLLTAGYIIVFMWERWDAIFATLVVTYIFVVRTVRWCIYFFEIALKKERKIITNGYVRSSRERVYFLDLSKKLHYTVIVFDDKRLKGSFIWFENELGPLDPKIEVVYYPISKVIKSITGTPSENDDAK